MIAAFMVAMGTNGQVKRVPMAKKVVPQEAPVKMKKAPESKTKFLAPTHVKTNVSRRAAGDLAGTYILDFANWDGDFTASSAFTITAETGTIKVVSENEQEEEIEVDFEYNLCLENFTFTDAKVYAFYDETENTILIPYQAAGTYSTKGTYRVSGLLTVNGEPYNYGFDILLTVDEDGNLENYDFADELKEAGWPEGSAITGFFTKLVDGGYLEMGTTMDFYAVNASMGSYEVHLTSGAWGEWTKTEHPVAVEDYGSEVVVHNFFGLCPLSITIEGSEASITTPVRMMNDDFAGEGAEEPDYMQLWQWNEDKSIPNPGKIVGKVSELKDGRKAIEFYDTDEEGYIHTSSTQFFMVHSTYGDSGAYWWGEAQGLWVLYGSETTGVNAIISANNNGIAKSYNLMGQEVNASAKGLVIRDGKKFVVK